MGRLKRNSILNKKITFANVIGAVLLLQLPRVVDVADVHSVVQFSPAQGEHAD